MKKLTTSVLAVVLSSSFAVVSAQKVQDTAKTQDIEGVVVTALGIKREKKALGYSTQSISAEDLTKSPTSNFTSNLAGKVAGLNIKQSGNVGGSVDITLRGYRSMTGNNQPLFVIDLTVLSILTVLASMAPPFRAQPPQHFVLSLLRFQRQKMPYHLMVMYQASRKEQEVFLQMQ